MSGREYREEREYLGFYWNLRPRPRRDRRSLTKAIFFSMVVLLCMALLAHTSLWALSGLQEASGQGQTSLPASQEDLAAPAPAPAPTAAQYEPDQSSASGCCYGQWYLLIQALNEVVHAKTG